MRMRRLGAYLHSCLFFLKEHSRRCGLTGMSETKFHCPNCDQHLEAEEDMRGKLIACPTCGVGFAVPGAAISPTPAALGEAALLSTAPETGLGHGSASGSDQLSTCQADLHAGAVVRARRLAARPALVAFAALVLFGFVIMIAFLARAGKPLALGLGERADAPKTRTAFAAQYSPTEGRSPAIRPAAQEISMEEMLAGVPAEAQRTIQAQVGQGEIASITRLRQEGVTIFDVEMSQEDVTRSFTVARDGQLLSFEVFESELPAAVKALIERELGKVDFTRIERGTEDGQPVYSIEAVSEGQTKSLTVNGDSWSLEVGLGEVPAQVQETVRRAWRRDAVTHGSKRVREGEVAYEFETEKDGLQHSLTAAPDGRTLVQQDEISWNQTPLAVRSTVEKQSMDRESAQIIRTDYQGDVCYEVTGTREGSDVEFSVSPAGKLLEPER